MPQPSDSPLDRDAPPLVAPESGRGTEGRTPGRPSAGEVRPETRQRERGEAGALGAPDTGELRPIGPERLRELRESIRNGTYPLEDRACHGLLRMFLGHAPRPPDADGESP